MFRQTLWIRKLLSRTLPNKFSNLYSTLDDPKIVPIQAAAYRLVAEKYLKNGDHLLDVGFGLGYGLKILSDKNVSIRGVDIDQRTIKRARELMLANSKIKDILHYDGKTIPYSENEFDVVTCIDVLEHVHDYLGLIKEMLRVSNRLVIISTPNRRPENTRPNGKPRNYWHLREWNFDELDSILKQFSNIQVEWNVLDGSLDGPFIHKNAPGNDTIALTPAINLHYENSY